MTTFKRRTIHHDNMSSNGGGALWNEGTTMLMSNGFLKGNGALVRSWVMGDYHCCVVCVLLGKSP